MTCMNNRAHQGVAHIRVFKEPKILHTYRVVRETSAGYVLHVCLVLFLNIATTSIHGLLDGSRLVMLGNTDGDT
jgi:hypothetical protein